MGHTRLGRLPATGRWVSVVDALSRPSTVAGARASAPTVAAAAAAAASPALRRAVDDAGLRESLYLLVQLVLAARSDNWPASLPLDIEAGQDLTLLGLVSAAQAALDERVMDAGLDSDVGEIAQRAFGEALTSLARDEAQTLFGEDTATVRHALKQLSTKAGFGRLVQRFFGGFLSRFLNFYVCRASAGSLGSTLLPQLGALSSLDTALAAHCDDTARIVRDFASEWYSKTEYLEGIDRENTNRFLAVALKKLSAELDRQANDG